MSRPLTRWAGIAALAVMLSGGCSSDPEPKEPDPTSSSTPDTTATPPPLPDLATQETSEGAATFVDYYLDVLNYAAHTGDTDPLEAISDSGCAGCYSYIDKFKVRHDAGGWRTGGEWSADELTISPFGSDVAIVTELVSEAGTVAEHDTDQPQEFNASTEQVTFIATFIGGSWKMLEYVLGDQS